MGKNKALAHHTSTYFHHVLEHNPNLPHEKYVSAVYIMDLLLPLLGGMVRGTKLSHVYLQLTHLLLPLC